MTTRFPLILLLNVAGLALFFSWYIPANHGFWFPLDSGIFHFFNQALVKSDAFLWLVAITNNRAFDGFSLLAMGCLMLSFWLKEDKAGRRRILIIGLVMLLFAVVINQLATAIIPVKRSNKRCVEGQFPRRSRHDAAHFFRSHASLFRPKSVCHSPDYFCGFCLPARNDWRSLVHRYCCRFALRCADCAAVVFNDPAERQDNSVVRSLSSR